MALLSVEDIDTFYGESHILHDVSLEVERGEIAVLVGRNGVGKTTTLRSILGHTPPERGTITYDGSDITGAEPSDVAQRGIGWVPEERRILPSLTVEENLQLSLRGGNESIETAYELFPRLEERSQNQGRNLSGGEQQMLAIARGVLGEFDLLLIDEPTEGLAPMIVEQVVDALTEIFTETTVLLVEQNLNVVRELGDRFYVMDKGQIVAETAELDPDSELVREYLGVSVSESSA
ncbi:ABC transporter ATP-binding protein [Natrarchaeobius oligotrophus]|uniref:ABC transporter ATP-binding protein n=1 Tax=Natrarchaeobius chitinivorans TaxID=1679083 RepID=A0A3N6NJY4_NATCH|nr:ABC transporter ATP-binding protein [Natrarchaeobius chitinivorans]RQG99462.1 ABC transporter ATP-binding protein [Natrarchaeobius chitinivorans]